MHPILVRTRPVGPFSVFSRAPAVNRMRISLPRTARRRTLVAALSAGLGCVLAVLAPSGSARAYIPSLEEIYQLVAARQPALQRALLETRTYVFDPLARRGEPAGDDNPDALPGELPARSFRQKIYWIRNAFLGIETLAEDGKPLHFYLNEGFRAIQGDLTPTRTFSEADVVH